MNLSPAGLWNNPPPSGINNQDVTEEQAPSEEKPALTTTNREAPIKGTEEPNSNSHKRSDCRRHHKKRSRSRSRTKRRSRSRSRSYRRRHRSRSRHRHRKSRSRSAGRHRRRSRSCSKSPSHDRSRHKYGKEYRRRRSRKHSRSVTRSRSRSSNRRNRYSRLTRKSYSRSPAFEKASNSDDDAYKDDEDAEEANKNTFKNDGTFLELFKKMQEEQQQKVEAEKAEQANTSDVKKPPLFSKRRGGRVLKTGVVAKKRVEDEMEESNSQDPWSIYLKEVKRYKEACCDDDSKTRPLVK